MAYVRIRPRRSTAEEWEYNNPILAEGEMGIEVPPTGVGTGTVKIKFGDGVTAWQDLPYGLNPDDFQSNTGGDDSGDDEPTEPIIPSTGGLVLDESTKVETEEIPLESTEDDNTTTEPDIDVEPTTPEVGGDDTTGDETQNT